MIKPPDELVGIARGDWWAEQSRELNPGDLVRAWTDFTFKAAAPNSHDSGDFVVVLRYLDAEGTGRPTFLVKHLFYPGKPFNLNFGFGYEKVGHIGNIEHWLADVPDGGTI